MRAASSLIPGVAAAAPAARRGKGGAVTAVREASKAGVTAGKGRRYLGGGCHAGADEGGGEGLERAERGQPGRGTAPCPRARFGQGGQGERGPGCPADVADGGDEQGAVIAAGQGGGDLVPGWQVMREGAAAELVQGGGQAGDERGEQDRRGGGPDEAGGAVRGHGWGPAPPWASCAVADAVADSLGRPVSAPSIDGVVTVTVTVTAVAPLTVTVPVLPVAAR